MVLFLGCDFFNTATIGYHNLNQVVLLSVRSPWPVGVVALTAPAGRLVAWSRTVGLPDRGPGFVTPVHGERSCRGGCFRNSHWASSFSLVCYFIGFLGFTLQPAPANAAAWLKHDSSGSPAERGQSALVQSGAIAHCCCFIVGF